MTGVASHALLPLVATLEARARAARTLMELGFSIVNDSFALLPFRQAFVYRQGSAGLLAVSGLAKPVEDSPYLVWLRQAWAWLQPQLGEEPCWLAFEEGELPEAVRSGWQEWWSSGLYVVPLRRRSGEALGWACFLLEEPPTAPSAEALQQLSATWSYCWEALAGAPRRTLLQHWRALGTTTRYALPVLLLLLLLVPVRQSVLAPAEVISLDATVIAAPLDGVVETIAVRPNQTVRAGEPLFSLDDTVLRNQLAVATKSVDVADLELMSARARAFGDQPGQDDVTLLTGRVKERRAEMEAIAEQLQRSSVNAPQDGIAVFGDPDDWLGRPVSTGERIMLLADPQQPGILIHLPIADAIALQAGAPVTLFLTVDPLAPLDATVIETGYQVVISPQGTASYRLRARFDSPPASARIGLQGTAKLYGQTVSLGYYLLRRPLAAMREWSGW